MSQTKGAGINKTWLNQWIERSGLLIKLYLMGRKRNTTPLNPSKTQTPPHRLLQAPHKTIRFKCCRSQCQWISIRSRWWRRRNGQIWCRRWTIIRQWTYRDYMIWCWKLSPRINKLRSGRPKQAWKWWGSCRHKIINLKCLPPTKWETIWTKSRKWPVIPSLKRRIKRENRGRMRVCPTIPSLLLEIVISTLTAKLSNTTCRKIGNGTV